MSLALPIDGVAAAGPQNETRELFTPSLQTRRLSNVAAIGICMNVGSRDQSCMFFFFAAIAAAEVEQPEGC